MTTDSRHNLHPLRSSLISRNIRVLPDPGITKVLRKYCTKDARRSLSSGKAPRLSRRYSRRTFHEKERRMLHYCSVRRKEKNQQAAARDFSDDVFIGLLVPSTRGFTFARSRRTRFEDAK